MTHVIHANAYNIVGIGTDLAVDINKKLLKKTGGSECEYFLVSNVAYYNAHEAKTFN